jgi:hypothetical protein
MPTQAEVFFLVFGAFFTTGLCALVYFLGRLQENQRKTDQASLLAVVYATQAMGDARSLKNATIIQRIVERYTPPTEPLTETEQLARQADFADQWADMMGFPNERPKQTPTMPASTGDKDFNVAPGMKQPLKKELRTPEDFFDSAKLV